MMTFEQNLLGMMGFPKLESAHQALLGALLATQPRSVADLLGGAGLELADTVAMTGGTVRSEHHLDGERDSRIDILVRFDELVVGIECKQEAYVEPGQLLRYAEKLAREPNPVLLFITAEGSRPRYPSVFVERVHRLGVRVGFLRWDQVLGVIPAAVDAGAMESAWRAADNSTGKFVDAILRGADYADLPRPAKHVGHRVAVLALAQAVCDRAGAGWSVVQPPLPGPIGHDLQCDIAVENWIAPLGRLEAPGPAMAWFQANNPFLDDEVRVAARVRFHFDHAGRLKMVFGTDVTPYLNFAPKKVKSDLLDALERHRARLDAVHQAVHASLHGPHGRHAPGAWTMWHAHAVLIRPPWRGAGDRVGAGAAAIASLPVHAIQHALSV